MKITIKPINATGLLELHEIRETLGEFHKLSCDGYTDIIADKSTLAQVQDFELARGLAVTCVVERLKRLN